MRPASIFATLAAIFMLSACGVEQNIEGAKEEINNFHYHYDAEEYGDIWEKSAPAMKKASNKKAFVEFLTGVRAALGEEKSSKQTGWNMQSTTDGSFVTITMQTEFERGSGVEVFTFKNVGDEPSLVGYNVNSDDMMKALMEDAAAGRSKEGAN